MNPSRTTPVGAAFIAVGSACVTSGRSRSAATTSRSARAAAVSNLGPHSTPRSGEVRVSWWHAGGLHAHVTYPDGSWMRRTWKADSWWEIDALVFDLKGEYESVWVNP